MKPVLLFALALAAAVPAPADWTTEKPRWGLVQTFDSKCVTVKAEDGSLFKIGRALVSDIALESGRTRIPYFARNLPKLKSCE